MDNSALWSSCRFFSNDPRYFSYASLKLGSTLDENMSSPRGFVAGGIGARVAARFDGDVGIGGEGERGVAGGSGD